MAVSPESMPGKPLDFRAPPPSPITSGRRSCVTNDDVLTEFLEHSLRVPDLILPDKVFPRQKFIENPPKVDFQSLESMQSEAVSKFLDSVYTVGCFQLVNHGIPSEFINSSLATAAGVFRVSSEKKTVVRRSPEKLYGFEEAHHGDDDEGSELSEEFVWCRDQSLELEMEGIWPLGYSKFREKMESLMTDIEKVAEKILQVVVVKENSLGKLQEQENVVGSSVCYVYKHDCRNVQADSNSLMRYDVIRMLIRGVDFSHALCLHICDGASEFHVYSKKDWISFFPEKLSIIVTTGDQIQALSGGQLKHVMGRPIFKADEKEDCISMAVLYSPPSISSSSSNSSSSSYNPEKGNIISLGQQFIAAIIITLLYQFLVYVCKKF